MGGGVTGKIGKRKGTKEKEISTSASMGYSLSIFNIKHRLSATRLYGRGILETRYQRQDKILVTFKCWFKSRAAHKITNCTFKKDRCNE